jgi:hypothetical protein
VWIGEWMIETEHCVGIVMKIRGSDRLRYVEAHDGLFHLMVGRNFSFVVVGFSPPFLFRYVMMTPQKDSFACF